MLVPVFSPVLPDRDGAQPHAVEARRQLVFEERMETTRIQIPTYDPDGEVEFDYTRPQTLTLQDADGLRVVMGAPDDENPPDVQIERAVDLWRIFVQPDWGGSLCIIEIQRDCATIYDERGKVLLRQDLR